MARSLTQVASQLVEQQYESDAQTHVLMAAFVQPTPACTVQQSPTLEHVPWLHVVPAQHSALAAHAEPAGLHCGAPLQKPPTQEFPPQQSAADTQACPWVLHVEQAPL